MTEQHATRIERDSMGEVHVPSNALYGAQTQRAVENFPVDVFQTGSGTSSNMNANEVIATLASRALGRAVHPNDDVHCSQSSNDVMPTAIHVGAALELAEQLLPALDHLVRTIEARASVHRASSPTRRSGT